MENRVDDWKSVREDIVLDFPEYRLSLEEYRKGSDQMVFVHLYVWQGWSLSLLKRLRHEWAVLRKHVTGPLFCCADTEDGKWVKFVTLFGWQPLLEAICINGERRNIYLHQGIGNGQVNTNSNTKSKLDDGPVSIPDAVSTTGIPGCI